MKSFRELDVWQKAMMLTDSVYLLVQNSVRRGWLAPEGAPRELMDDVSKMLGVLSRRLRATATPR